MTHADLFVADDMDTPTMIRVYARENATQRGNSSTAVLGSVASAVRYITKAVHYGDETGSPILDEPPKSSADRRR